MSLNTEIKRKIFHHLSLVYLLIYAIFPLAVSLWLLTLVLIVLAKVEFIRIRRPEINAWFLKKFGGIHRPSEILAPSGIFWTLLGCWVTIVVFPEKRIVLPALGLLVFGDTAAALWGRRKGVHYWTSKPRPDDSSSLSWVKFWRIPANSEKTLEGSGAFAVTSFLWISLFLRPHVALLGALSGAWVESRKTEWNDNFWIPLAGGLLLSIMSLALAGGADRPLHRWQEVGIGLYLSAVLGGFIWLSKSMGENRS